MKKILQGIGLLAAAVLLLWGWQGMNAKADDYTGNWTVDRTGLKNCHIMLSTMIDSKMYDCFLYTREMTVIMEKNIGF